MVDFVKASPLRYALTFKPTIYVSHIRLFWSTARIKTTEEGTQILATVDGVLRIVTESSLRRNLKLQDEEGISSLPDTELFENLTLMGYNISPNQKFTFQKDEPASPMRDVSQGEACPTDSGFIVDQDRATIAKSSTLLHDSGLRVTSLADEEGTQEVEINRLKERVKILEDKKGVIGDRSGDDAPIKGIRIDEEEFATERVSSYTEEVRLDEGEVAAKKASDDTEEMATVLTTIDAATVLASRTVKVPTGSGSIPTAGPPAAEVPTGNDMVPTASPVFATTTVVTPYRRRKGKEVMVESETLKKQKLQEQIDAQIARELKEQLEKEDQRRSEQIARDEDFAMIHAEEELQIMIDGLDRSNEEKFKTVWEQIKGGVSKIFGGEAAWFKRKGIRSEQESAKKQKISKEVPKKVKSSDEVPDKEIKEMMQLVPIEEVYVEALQHLDRDDLNQLWSSVKETLSKRPATSDKEMELWVELSRLYEPNVEDQLWTNTQNFMHAPAEWKLYDKCGVHQLTSKDKDIFMVVEKNYPLRKGLALVMISYKLQVENYS
nr:hypothetical protein [Tanacetum cinerariifolium]